MHLYHCDRARSFRSLWLLHELGIAFKLTVIPFAMESLRTPEYLAISPLGRVPCLVDGTTTIFESGAITQYLCEHYDQRGLGRDTNHPERTKWLIWLHYAETMAVHAASLIQQTIFIAPADRSPVVRKLESRRLLKSLEVLERHLVDREYLLRSGFSAVDTNVGYSVHIAHDFVAFDTLPNVTRYYARLQQRPAFQAAVENRSSF